MPDKPRIEIHYCPACHWLPRSAWMAQELLHTFNDELAEVALLPASESGRFEIRLGQQLIWDRKRDGGFPDIKTLKQRIRDEVAPDRALGHLDR
ncbi:MAG: SelT/selW/selH selenoprotein [Gammaproteobacteria bacterium]|nr:MAG: SelT/selW/selH selenoprotein [Gammaproteobacteria bacterium]RLA50504.1 MAG: SelT/selW/selH selenoprotein [Gammaproteobacteria bacterium]